MSELKRPTRLISIDIMKGIGILGMLFSHAFFKGVWYTEGNAAAVVGEHAPWVIPLALPLIIAGTWPGFFVLITGLLNAYLTARRLEKGRTMRQAVSPLYISAVLFLLIHIFMVTVLHDFRPDLHHPGKTSGGLFGNLLAGNGMVVSSGQWYIHTILSLLAFANVFFALTLSVVFRNRGWTDIRRTGGRLVLLTLIIFALTALISEPSYRLIIHLVEKGGVLNHIIIFIIQSLSGSQLDLIPLAAYGCVGIIVSLFLLADPERKNFEPLDHFLKTSAWIAFLSGILLIVIRVLTAGTGPVDAIFLYEPYPLHLAVFNMGLILFILKFALRKFEYASTESLKIICDRTGFIRAAGMLTLTLYVLEFPVRTLFSYWGHFLFGGRNDFPAGFKSFTFDGFMIHPAGIALFMICIMAFWCGLIFVLMKLKFKGSFEWLFTKVANLLRKHDKSVKSDMDTIFYPFGRFRPQD